MLCHTKLLLAPNACFSHVLALLCVASSPMNALFLSSLPRPVHMPSLPGILLLTFQEPDLAFPSLGSFLWTPSSRLRWPLHMGSFPPWYSNPKHRCLFSHWTHSFLCQSLRGNYCAWGSCRMNQLIEWINEVSQALGIHIEISFYKFQSLDIQIEGMTAFCGSLDSALNPALAIGIKLWTKINNVLE